MILNTKDAAIVVLTIALSLAAFHSWVCGLQAALIAERFGTLALQRRVPTRAPARRPHRGMPSRGRHSALLRGCGAGRED